jgi:hypothetical protein
VEAELSLGVVAEAGIPVSVPEADSGTEVDADAGEVPDVVLML